ncbi:hypothetical protein ACFT5B_06830 [Luteimicrobium sp. NPDC057192]|uniref:hypothetical protein n=1 Tax=Luteimicrobium sp. NPDC057192 TaxID=3346042 RepID=UPI00362ED962
MNADNLIAGGEKGRRTQTARATERKEARLEDLEFMAATGETWEGAIRRQGVSETALERFLARCDRWDVRARLVANGERSHLRTYRLVVAA